MCPLCGEVLYKGYCDKCESNFSGIGYDERAYLSLISASGNMKLESFSDRRALIASATKGIDDLKKTWPSIQVTFDSLKSTSSLPSLKKIRTLPNIVKQSDPFNVK